MFNFSHDFFVFCCYVGELSFGVKELKGVKTTVFKDSPLSFFVLHSSLVKPYDFMVENQANNAIVLTS